ncbi:MAG: ferrous iron transport protein B [Verrucomicrobia bacterium]|nr:ferrous iron transport protein B [Verrucomicrobiota bacterium]
MNPLRNPPDSGPESARAPLEPGQRPPASAAPEQPGAPDAAAARVLGATGPGRGSGNPVPAPTTSPRPSKSIPPYVAVTGNPNCGKTTLFNALTGLRAKVGNYAGVTVERKEGRLLGAPPTNPVMVLDLPGTYSLSPQSLDEQIARDVLFHRLLEVPAAAAVIVVVDASNLQRNLYFATQVIELGYPTIIALNMTDVAEANGHRIDASQLAAALGVPVVPMIASLGQGVPDLRRHILDLIRAGNPPPSPARFCALPPLFAREAEAIADQLRAGPPSRGERRFAEALLLLTDAKNAAASGNHYPPAIHQEIATARRRLEAAGIDWRSATIEARYARAAVIQQAVTTEEAITGETFSDKLDRVLTHRIWGVLIFVAIMTLMFQSIFSFARIPMDLLTVGVDWMGSQVAHLLPPGDLQSLLVDGVIQGVGAVIVFLPQICLLFLFISLLEDTGYMARAAFLMDRLMSRVGLHGKSFIPMLSSFACAIPGIMATRTIESPKDRLVTILVSPLMSCSARLPVYTLLIAACIPERRYLGVLTLSGLTMLSMYLLGIVVALLMAWLFKKTLLRSGTPLLIMELPPYKRPVLATIVRHMWDRSKLFLRRAGTVILGINILLWFLATYPRSAAVDQHFAAQRQAILAQRLPSESRPRLEPGRAELPLGQAAPRHRPPTSTIPTPEQRAALDDLNKTEAGEKLRRSFAGRLGQLIEPAIAPLGFDWKMGVGIVASFAAREVFVSTMATVYNVGDYDKSETAAKSLADTLRAQKREDGSLVYTPLVAVTLMVFYVFALQCVSTVAIVRRETNSWKWPLFQWAYMGLLAWGLAFLTYQGGRLLGLG